MRSTQHGSAVKPDLCNISLRQAPRKEGCVILVYGTHQEKKVGCDNATKITAATAAEGRWRLASLVR